MYFFNSKSYIKIKKNKIFKKSELSGGQKQRALIALAIAQDTETIVSYEPTNHLDIKAQLAIMHLLHDLNHNMNRTIITVIHDINHALKFSDTVIVMKAEKVALHVTTYYIKIDISIEEIFGVKPKIIKSHKKKIFYDYWIKDLKSPNEYHGDKDKKIMIRSLFFL